MAWVRIGCVRCRDRGPYHWTRECVEGRALIEITRAEADAMSNLRPPAALDGGRGSGRAP
jgi:hypothetical protein